MTGWREQSWGRRQPIGGGGGHVRDPLSASQPITKEVADPVPLLPGHLVSRYLTCAIRSCKNGRTHIPFDRHIHMFYYGATGTLFWISGDISHGSQSHSGFCLICVVEVHVMFIPQDQPLVLHIASLLMVSIVGHQFQMVAQCCHLPEHSLSLGLESNTGSMCRSPTHYHCVMFDGGTFAEAV